MFNSENATKNIAVSVKLTNGTYQRGNLVIAMTSDLMRTLNGETKFLEFVDMSGEQCFFAKHAIAEITPSEIPKVRKLDAGGDSNEDFNPFRILKISPEADAEAIQKAYYERAKLYHPDRFSNSELPEEMASYAENMCRLINAAFQALNDKVKQPAE